MDVKQRAKEWLAWMERRPQPTRTGLEQDGMLIIRDLLAALDEAETRLTATIKAQEEVLQDHRRLVRKLDVIWNRENDAAVQASLCDMVAQIERGKPVLTATIEQQKKEIERLKQSQNIEIHTPPLPESEVLGYYRKLLTERDTDYAKLRMAMSDLHNDFHDLQSEHAYKMQQYAATIRAQTIEQCAQIAEVKGMNQDCLGSGQKGYYVWRKDMADNIASAIRGMKDEG